MLYKIMLRGYQWFTVEANSDEDALQKHADGESRYEDEEFEAYSLGASEVEKVDTV